MTNLELEALRAIQLMVENCAIARNEDALAIFSGDLSLFEKGLKDGKELLERISEGLE